MKKIVVFGATGTVGAYTCRRLCELGYGVVAVARRKSDNGYFKDELGIDYYSVDITQKENFEKLPMEEVDTVIHYAGAMPARMNGYNPQLYIDTIVTGTLNVLEYTRKTGAKKIIFTQSISDAAKLLGTTAPIPADIHRSYPMTGDHSVYVISKNMAVDLIEHYHAAYGLNRFILRLPTIYLYHPDPNYYVDGKKRMMGYRALIEKAQKGEPIEIWGDPNRKKEIVYVKDFVQIVVKAVQSDKEGGFYNVGGDECVTIEEQVRGIVDVFSPSENKSKVTMAPDMPDGNQFIFDISKTKEELGYQPQYTYRQALEDMKKEMSDNPFGKLWA